MAKQKDIKVVVKYTEGYQERFTKACCDALARRDRRTLGYPHQVHRNVDNRKPDGSESNAVL